MQVLLSLGSNLGDRGAHLNQAIDALDALPGVSVERRSRLYETTPIGSPDQPTFLNLALEIETDLGPLELLKSIKNIEWQIGRRPTEHWGPRVVDIDIILWGALEMQAPGLTIPHTAFRERAFVLRPLAEIAPDAVDPVTGLSVSELVDQPGVIGDVMCYASSDSGSCDPDH